MVKRKQKFILGFILLVLLFVTIELLLSQRESGSEVKKHFSFPTVTYPTTSTTTTTVAPTTTTSTTIVETTTTTVILRSSIDWNAIAMCESNGDWHINTGNGYYGGLQFSHETWISYGGGRYAPNAHLTSKENQIAIASTMALSHWPTCGRRGL